MVLSIIPCSDANNTLNHEETKTEFAQSHDHDSDASDQCSPFCVCLCCHSSVTIAKAFVNTIAGPVFQLTKAPVYRSQFHSNYYVDIWQPPKIS